MILWWLQMLNYYAGCKCWITVLIANVECAGCKCWMPLYSCQYFMTKIANV